MPPQTAAQQTAAQQTAQRTANTQQTANSTAKNTANSTQQPPQNRHRQSPSTHHQKTTWQCESESVTACHEAGHTKAETRRRRGTRDDGRANSDQGRGTTDEAQGTRAKGRGTKDQGRGTDDGRGVGRAPAIGTERTSNERTREDLPWCAYNSLARRWDPLCLREDTLRKRAAPCVICLSTAEGSRSRGERSAPA
jgi:hypothetical protein